MKKCTLLCLLFCLLYAIGQEKLNIEIDNPQPRVDEEVTFSINASFLSNYFKEELDKDIEFTRSTGIFMGSSDDFNRVIIFKEAKKYKIGPFQFEFNNKKYTTNIIEVEVLPKLEVKEGMWLRIAELEGKRYLILEQFVKNTSDYRTNGNDGYSHTVGGVIPEDTRFASLKEELLKGLKLNMSYSSTSTKRPEGADMFDIGFTYAFKKYEIQFDEDFKGKYVISKKDFENLPKSYDIGKITLKK